MLKRFVNTFASIPRPLLGLLALRIFDSKSPPVYNGGALTDQALNQRHRVRQAHSEVRVAGRSVRDVSRRRAMRGIPTDDWLELVEHFGADSSGRTTSGII